MSETQKIFNIKAKYYKKIFCRAEQIQFGEQTNQATGEIQKKQFQACLYIPDGEDTTCMPSIFFNLKLGNGSFTLIADDLATIIEAMKGTLSFLDKYDKSGTCIKAHNESKTKYIKKLQDSVNQDLNNKNNEKR